MIEREIPKEITDYKTKYLFKLTLRQNIAFGLMLIINLLLHFYGKSFLHEEIVNWLMLLVAALAGAIALWKPNKQDFEKVAWFAIQSELLYPKKRIYKTENIFTKMREEYLEEEREKERKQEEQEKYQARRERAKNNRLIKLLKHKEKKQKNKSEEEKEIEFINEQAETQGEIK